MHDLDSGDPIVKLYNPTDTTLYNAANGNPYCDILQIISDLGLSSKVQIGYISECSSYVIYVDVKQHYFDMIVSISDFLEKHEVDIDAFNFATMDLMLPITEPIGLAYKSVQLSIRGVKPIVALESLAKLTGKTLTEVMGAIKAGMPLLGKVAKAIANAPKLLDEFTIAVRNGSNMAMSLSQR